MSNFKFEYDTAYIHCKFISGNIKTKKGYKRVAKALAKKYPNIHKITNDNEKQSLYEKILDKWDEKYNFHWNVKINK